MFVLPLRYVRRRGSDTRPGGSAGTRCVVPVERIELPTFGLQNRCSTAELNRRIGAIGEGRSIPPLGPIFGGSNIRLGRKGPEPQEPLFIAPAWKRRPFQPPFPGSIRKP